MSNGENSTAHKQPVVCCCDNGKTICVLYVLFQQVQELKRESLSEFENILRIKCVRTAFEGF